MTVIRFKAHIFTQKLNSMNSYIQWYVQVWKYFRQWQSAHLINGVKQFTYTVTSNFTIHIQWQHLWLATLPRLFTQIMFTCLMYKDFITLLQHCKVRLRPTLKIFLLQMRLSRLQGSYFIRYTHINYVNFYQLQWTVNLIWRHWLIISTHTWMPYKFCQWTFLCNIYLQIT